jgi:hypothetical protein
LPPLITWKRLGSGRLQPEQQKQSGWYVLPFTWRRLPYLQQNTPMSNARHGGCRLCHALDLLPARGALQHADGAAGSTVGGRVVGVREGALRTGPAHDRWGSSLCLADSELDAKQCHCLTSVRLVGLRSDKTLNTACNMPESRTLFEPTRSARNGATCSDCDGARRACRSLGNVEVP